jgi:hypothetical protein
MGFVLGQGYHYGKPGQAQTFQPVGGDTQKF